MTGARRGAQTGGVRRALLPLLLLFACGAEPGLERPNYARVEATGTVLVSDLLRQRVVRLSPEGELLAAFGGPGIGRGQLWRVRGLAVLEDGGFAVVNHRPGDGATDGSASYQELKVFDARGREQRAFPLRPPGEPEGWAEGVAVVPEGFAVTDTARDAVLFFGPEGRLLRRIDRVQGGPPLDSPQNARWDGTCLWLVEYQAHRVRCVDLEGRQVAAFGTEGRAPGELLFPMSVVAHPTEGWVAVADLGNHRVQRLSREGELIEEIALDGVTGGVPAQVLDVDLTAEGSLLVTDSKGDRALRWRPGGGLEGELRGL